MLLKIKTVLNIFIADFEYVLVFLKNNLNMQIFHLKYPEAAVHRCSTRKILKDVVKFTEALVLESLFSKVASLQSFQRFKNEWQESKFNDLKALEQRLQ